MTVNDRQEPAVASNSDAIRARIAELRRERTAALGKASRARKTRADLLWKIDSEEAIARRCQALIEALGGKVGR